MPQAATTRTQPPRTTTAAGRQGKRKDKATAPKGTVPWLEWGTATLLAVLALVLHLTFLIHAGPLWRDEVNTAEIATMPSMSSLLGSLRFDGFPALSVVALRGWEALGMGASDPRIRVFGFIVGLAVLSVTFMACRVLGSRTPLVSLALLGLNPVAVVTTDSIRPYGLGIVGIVATLALLWRAIELPTRNRFLLAGAMTIFSVQCMYQNAFLLLGLCLAGVLMLLRSGRRGATWGVVLVGLVAALSLLPYRGNIAEMRSWNALIQTSASMKELFMAFRFALGPIENGLLWLALAALTIYLGVDALRRKPEQRASERAPSAALFCAATLVFTTALFWIAMAATRLRTQPWYYVPLMATLAPVLERVGWFVTRQRVWGGIRVLAILGIAAATTFPAWRALQERRTNVDLVASAVAKEAKPGDAIVVFPWYYGVSFHRYYHGHAGWMTLPPLGDVRIHRYDLLKVALTQSETMNPLREKVAGALESGHRVWLVGGLPPVRTDVPPDPVPEAPAPKWGWYSQPYLMGWARETAYLIQSHALAAERVPVTTRGAVNSYEDVPIFVVSGWR